MEEIKVGEYFRTHDGHIGKIEEFLMNDTYFHNMPYYRTNISYTMPGCYTCNRIYQDMIAKHSPNLIDLIEVGDYVNGKRVDFDRFENKLYVGNDYDYQTFIKDMEIKTIVTHEQFKSVMYEV